MLKKSSLLVVFLASALSPVSPASACPAGTPAEVSSAKAVRVAGNQSLVDVRFSEDVVGSSTPAHWAVTGKGWVNLVIGVTPLTSDAVRLSLALSLSDDPGGKVAYRGLAGTGYRDTCANVIPDADVGLEDGIAPLAPSIDLVADLPLQSGSFYTNDATPTVAASGSSAVASGYVVEIYEETNGTAGLQRATDTLIGDDEASGSSVTVATSLGGSDRSTTIHAVSIDVNDNVGSAASAALVLDRVAPQIDNVDFQATSIVVSFTEPLPRGRDAAEDWAVFDDGDAEVLVIDIASSSAGSSRSLIVGASYDPASVMFLAYAYLGPTGSRYADRAGNHLADFATCFSHPPSSEICP